MSFHVGQHVICVDDKFGLTALPIAVPKKGVVYTVREVIPEDKWGPSTLRLHEVVNPLRAYAEGLCENSWDARAFRPLSSDRLSIFRQHLAPLSTDKVDA